MVSAEYECPKCGGEVHLTVAFCPGSGDGDFAMCMECDWTWAEGEGTEVPFSDEAGGGS